MLEVDLLNMEKGTVGKVSLPENAFAVKVRGDIMHEAVKAYLANQRQGTASIKGKGEVRGGGRKPWRQKGTGRSRAGSIRSPLWRGGGVVFGPKPRDYTYKIPKKVKQSAIRAAFSSKLKDGDVIVIDRIEIKEPKTKLLVSQLKTLSIENKSLLIITDKKYHELILAARNIPNVKVLELADVNVYELLSYEKLLLTAAAVEKLKKSEKE